MKALILAAAVAAAAPGGMASESPANAKRPAQLAQAVTTCFQDGEQTSPSSQTKICFYKCLGDRVAITVAAYQLCPITIKR